VQIYKLFGETFLLRLIFFPIHSYTIYVMEILICSYLRFNFNVRFKISDVPGFGSNNLVANTERVKILITPPR
jgi:hypothetical protein